MCIDFHGFSKVEEKDVKNVERACFFPRSYDTLLGIRGKEKREENQRMEEEKLEEIFDYYKKQDTVSSQETLVAMLREIQEEEGCIPEDIQIRIEEEIGVKKSVLSYIIKMYPSLKAAPYRHRIVICSGERCKNAGQKEIMDFIKQEIQIGKDGISKDGRICISVQNCLKHCRTSPNMMIDGKVVEHVTVDKIKQIMKTLR